MAGRWGRRLSGLRSTRGQAKAALVIGLLNTTAALGAVQAVGATVHMVPDELWHLATWGVAVLVGLVAFFGRRMVKEVEDDIRTERNARRRIEKMVQENVTRLAVIERTCGFWHGSPPPRRRSDGSVQDDTED